MPNPIIQQALFNTCEILKVGYLALVIDLYSRKVVGWSMSKRLTSTLVCDTLLMALWHRRPPKGQVIHCADRGVHRKVCQQGVPELDGTAWHIRQHES